MKTFKNIITLIGSLFLSLLLIGFLFLSYKYITQSKAYKEYQNKIELITKENKILNEKVADFLSKAQIYAAEKADLLDKLSKKQIQIVEKEKLVYVDGKLSIPGDYDSLKVNYLILGENYELVKAMYAALLEQSNTDSKIIKDAESKIQELVEENEKLVEIINNPVEKPVKFFTQSFLVGAGIDVKNEKIFHIGYLVTIKDKLQAELLLGYPLQASALIGVKF